MRGLAMDILVVVAVTGAACGGQSAGTSHDAGSSGGDAASNDAGASGSDAASDDAGAPPIDASPDAGLLAMTYHAFDAPTPRTRIVYDSQRQTLYAVDQLDERLQRYTYDGTTGTWSTPPAISVTALTDIALTPDGTTLVVLDRQHVSDVALANAPIQLVPHATNPTTFCGQFLHQAAAAANGKVLIATDLAGCSGFSTSYLYDVDTHTLDSSVALFDATIGGSADGSRIYGGDANLSPDQQLTIYNGQTGAFHTSTITDNLVAISVSDNASRVMLDNATVYSGALVQLGSLPLGATAAVSRSGKRAFRYAEDGAGPRVDIYDLEGQLDTHGVYPLLHTAAVADAALSGFGLVTITSTLDDSIVFVSGNRRVLVVPVPVN